MAESSSPSWRLRLTTWRQKCQKFVERAWQKLCSSDTHFTLGFVGLASCLIVPLSFLWRFWDDLNDTTYFYTFSTISQTLAGAFGFLVAVALHRIASIEGEMEKALNDVYPYAANKAYWR
jgi:hypothetical protein